MSGRRAEGPIEFCAYCKFETKGSPTSLKEVQAHVKVCKLHPLAKANQRIKELEKCDEDHVDELAQALSQYNVREQRLVAAIEASLRTISTVRAKKILANALKKHKGKV